jgi:THUMP domain-like/RNA cap guanine-N2 methyltransferase
MIRQLLQKNVQDFIEQHAQDDEQQLLLKHKTVLNVPVSLIAWQISGRRKAKIKFPLYQSTKGIVYPPGINLEQSSSQQTAEFKASVLAEVIFSRKSLIDLTGGFGVDSFFFSNVFESVQYIEPNAELIEYAKHNHEMLGAKNIRYNNTTAENFLRSGKEKANCVFIDPSRRTGTQKVVKLSDCEPDVTRLLPEIFNISSFLLIKTSPLLDVHQGIKELQFVRSVWVVSVENECKELLFLCEKDYAGEPIIHAVNLDVIQEKFSFTLADERNSTADFSDPLPYLYEPNASILKAGAFKQVAVEFSLSKLHPSTHLYTSKNLIENFPGRIFKVHEILKSDQKLIAAAFPSGKANVLTRNYPLSPDALKKKLKLKDGGEDFLIGCSGEKKKFLIAAERLK